MSSLSNLLSKDSVEIVSGEINFVQAVRKSLGILEEKTFIYNRYVKAVFDNLLLIGPYFYLGSGVCLIHSRPEDGANALGMSLLKLNTPAKLLYSESEVATLIDGFDESDTDEYGPSEDTCLFFSVAATDSNSHIDAMNTLAPILNNSEKLQQLKGATTVDEILDILV
jgi:mannitol/fructose-specific phosphotransferase system IIA component (Ntr-type)